jgi:hypothetical protein
VRVVEDEAERLAAESDTLRRQVADFLSTVRAA